MAVITLDDDWELLNEQREKVLKKVLGEERAKKLIDVSEDEEDIEDEDLLELIENAGTLENDGQ